MRRFRHATARSSPARSSLGLLLIPFIVSSLAGCDAATDAGPDSGMLRPVLIAPEDGADTPDAIRFVWESDASSGWYRLQVAGDSLFSTVEHDINSGTSTRHIVRDLEIGRTYFWRVRRETASGVDPWSDTGSFRTTHVAVLPRRPELINPPDLTGGLPTEITLEWTPVDEAIAYDLQVFVDEDLLLFHADLVGLTNTSYPVRDLVYTYPYWWRVRAESVKGKSAWSPVWKFQVKDGE